MTDPVPIQAPNAPAALGAYSHAVRHDSVLYCSGMLPLDPDTGIAVDSSPGAETTQCLQNLARVCDAGGTRLGRAIRMTIFTTELEAFAEINEAYGAFFPESPPARVTVGVAALPRRLRVEIDAIVAVT